MPHIAFTINTLNFMKIGTGVRAIIKFCFRNLRDCNIGITGERVLRSRPLKWTQVA
jgi:hypothetical protein